MSNNSILGNYDMVLSLSESKINYQFSELYDEEIISNEWGFLTDSEHTNVKTFSSKDEVLEYWKDIYCIEDQIETQEKYDVELSDKRDKAIEAEELAKVIEIYAELKELKVLIDKLKDRLKSSLKYDLSMATTIFAPEIIVQGQNKLTLKIAFKSGSLIYRKNKALCTYDFEGKEIVYAFDVGLSKIPVKETIEIIVKDENDQKTKKSLKDIGITDEDFTIESLFLDFTKSNVVNFNVSESSFPTKEDESMTPFLQMAITNYFKNINCKDNPYLLGYAISKRVVNDLEKGLFYPVGMKYSTSESKIPENSSINFLMVLNKENGKVIFPDGGNAGMLDQSLLDYSIDQTSTINAGLGITKENFESSYVSLLSNAIKNKIKGSMGSKCKSVNTSGYDINIAFAFDSDKGDLHVKYEGMKEVASQKAVHLVYTINANAKVSQQIETIEGTVGVFWSASTEGTKKEVIGSRGKLIIILKADDNGKLTCDIDYSEKLKLGFDKSEPELKHESDRTWYELNKDLGNFLSRIGHVTNNIGKGLNNLNELEPVVKSLNINNLQNMENKVILPISSVYTYKNVHLSKDKTVLLFDAAYKSN